MKKIISIFTCFVIVLSSLMLSSCGFVLRPDPGFPSGYTGGFPYYMLDNSGVELYWVETYDEYKAAVEKLISHGSKLPHSVVFGYEGDLFDTKYCFFFQGAKEFVRYGNDPFDRCARDVYVKSVAFFEDVTIDEIVFSYVNDYKCYSISTDAANLFAASRKMTEKDLVYKKLEDGGYIAYYNDKEMFRIENKGEYITEECIEAIKNSIEIVYYRED